MAKNSKNTTKRFTPKLKLKKGDQVQVIAGASKGMQGEILEMLQHKNRAIVKNVNIVKKHNKPTNENAGGINEMPAPIHISNLMLIDPKSGNPTRVGFRIEDDKVVRYSKKSGETIR